MIEYIVAKSGYAAELKNLKGRRFDFLTGSSVTVLFGPNGCGKSTLMKLAAGHTGIDTSFRMMAGGWNRYPRQWEAEFPQSFRETTVGKCEAEIGWDGSPCFFNSASNSEASANMSAFVGSEADSTDGITDFDEQVRLTMGHLSEGELRNHKIHRVIEAIKAPPKFEEPRKEAGDSEKAYYNYRKSLPRTGPVTLLWDEPDRSLSVEGQITFWSRFVLGLAQKHNVQVIVASHSLVLLSMPRFLKSFRIIDVEEGYLGRSKEQLEEMSLIARLLDKKAEEPSPEKEEPKPEEPAKGRRKSKKKT